MRKEFYKKSYSNILYDFYKLERTVHKSKTIEPFRKCYPRNVVMHGNVRMNNIFQATFIAHIPERVQVSMFFVRTNIRSTRKFEVFS